VARDHAEAYHLWAAHFSDPALMANRDAATTRWKLARVVDRLPLSARSRVLDVGPGDGTLFRLIAPRVRACRGVDPSEQAVRRLRELFAGVANVEFSLGSATRIPHPDAAFDAVVVNSVLQALPALEDVERAVAEAVRVCAPGGCVWIGELPFRSELGRGVLPHVARQLREFGTVAYGRLLYRVYLRPLLRGEPLLLYPARNLSVPAAELAGWCARLGVRLEAWRHREIARPSSTRNDYLLHRSLAGTMF
jgi:SAM-dependent methyltransferase